MSLYIKRIYPTPRDFESLASFEAEEPRATVTQSDVLGIGVTICIPGEPDEAQLEATPASPIVARFVIPGGDAAAAPELCRHLMRRVMIGLFKGEAYEIMPGRYWQLLRNPSLAAELCGEVGPGALLLEERIESAEKMVPDSIYRLSRLDEHEFFADLMAQWESEGPEAWANRRTDDDDDEDEE